MDKIKDRHLQKVSLLKINAYFYTDRIFLCFITGKPKNLITYISNNAQFTLWSGLKANLQLNKKTPKYFVSATQRFYEIVWLRFVLTFSN